MKRFEYLVIGGIVMLSLLAVAFGARTVWAQAGTGAPATETPAMRTVMVSGEGQANAQPNEAMVQLGVQTDAEGAAQALSTNSQQMQSLLNAVRQAGVSDQDIQTQQVQLAPRYDNPGQQGGAPKLIGYTASNVVQVRVRDLAKVGQLLDAAARAGANRIQGISFEVSDTSAVAAQARKAAWNDALAKAQQLAQLAGGGLGEVLNINESSQIPRPLTLASADIAPQAAVPVQPGTQTFMSTVQVTWALTGAAAAPGGVATATEVVTPTPEITTTVSAAAPTLPPATIAALATGTPLPGIAATAAPTLEPTVAPLATEAPTAEITATAAISGATAAGTPGPGIAATAAPTIEPTVAPIATEAPTAAITATVVMTETGTPAQGTPEAPMGTAAPTPFIVMTASPPTTTLSLPAITAGPATTTPAQPTAGPTASAAAGQAGTGEVVIGQVQSVDTNTGAVRLTPTQQGTSVITTGPGTQVLAASGEAASLASLRPGTLIRADGRAAGDGSFAADRIQILPRSTLVTVIGKISQADANQHVLIISPAVHGFSTIYGSLNAPITRADGSQATWQDLVPGATVEAIGITDAPGSMVAYRLRILSR